MSEAYVSFVAEHLRQAGLTHPVLDTEEIAADLAERTELNESLDELIDSSEIAPVPTSFDPGWYE